MPKTVTLKDAAAVWPDAVSFQLFKNTFHESKYCHAAIGFNHMNQVNAVLDRGIFEFLGKKIYPFPAHSSLLMDVAKLGKQKSEETVAAAKLVSETTAPPSKKIKLEKVFYFFNLCSIFYRSYFYLTRLKASYLFNNSVELNPSFEIPIDSEHGCGERTSVEPVMTDFCFVPCSRVTTKTMMTKRATTRKTTVTKRRMTTRQKMRMAKTRMVKAKMTTTTTTERKKPTTTTTKATEKSCAPLRSNHLQT